MDRTPLFRPEALAAASDSGLGEPIAKLPVSWTLLSMAMGALLSAFIALMVLGTYTRREVALGLVSSTGNNIRITVPTPGIVRDVLVADGQKVRARQPLVTIETSHNGVTGRSVDEELISNLDRERANLKRRLNSLGQAAAIELRGMPARLEALRQEKMAAKAQERSANKRLAMATEALARIEPVAERGFISGESMRRRKEEIIILQQAIADARGAEARLDGQISELENQIARQPMLVAQQRGELLDQISRTQRDREMAAAQTGFTIRSPTSGVVTTLQIAKGQPVDGQMTLMTVSQHPKGSMLAELFVPSRAIGFLEPGQKVRLRFDAFPYQRFGVGTGRIKTISSTVLRPDQVAATIRIEEPVYRVVVSLDRDTIMAYGRQYHIRPGFALSADIVLERRSFAQWLLDPILALRGRL
ncbi:HlyD family efflux transporter periplasmic adaptor subunit [Sphingomonas sanguinis]|uniref:HlyD family secretion protein n=1 Tax=Sphingomonas sanguinis TaxID=33051 RepID=UPI001C58F87B|nr:HlyD family efflux transporter periplasmic adaptor subunit [Sphingomonas sanguinis]QXT34377.1 HlyD family efflux transporter periplasmic adaptor subunit [Sphingomonas sanguinis]